MSIPRCDTCPFAWPRDGGAMYCHHAQSPEHGKKLSPSWWCSLHPDAPQPVYEAIVVDSPGGRPPGGGWEPIAYHPEIDEAMILWRRVAGYTQVDEEEDNGRS